MTLVRYNPNRVLSGISRDFDSMLDSFFRAPVFKSDVCCDFMPNVDIVENKDSISLHMELPGMKKDAIKVMVEDGVLNISGERKQESEEKDRNYIRSERVYGSFSRSFTLPDNIESEKVTADYKDGVLKITLQKSEKAKPKEIAVEVN